MISRCALGNGGEKDSVPGGRRGGSRTSNEQPAVWVSVKGRVRERFAQSDIRSTSSKVNGCGGLHIGTDKNQSNPTQERTG